ncbi:MAG: tRNA uridine-5-carboxymethylaminomethyl(34) synthesis GTPase MnmE [Candidatus Firestonebacteria bacterium]
MENTIAITCHRINTDTICAISTPIGEGGIGIVRISGENSLSIAQNIFLKKGAFKIDAFNLPTFTTHYGHIINPVTKQIIDEVILTVMKAPHTYTREDIVEINCHGGVIPLKLTLELAMKYGARLAAPGEFTKRAFLNGRIDLSQAEAVIDVIRAKTDISLNASITQLTGKLKNEVETLRSNLIDMCAQIEAEIDFPEEEIENLGIAEFEKNIKNILEKICRLLNSFQSGKLLREGIKIAIIGKPNVGKSSLLNIFLNEERAIVTEIPGTTRDTIEEFLNIEGIPVKLIDTAGIRKTENIIEKIGVDKSYTSLSQADLIFLMLDSSADLTNEDEHILEKVLGKKVLILLNKIDLPKKINIEKLKEKAHKITKILEVSAKYGIGIDLLKKEVLSIVMSGEVINTGEILITNIRHKEVLEKSKNSLLHAYNSFKKNMSPEFIALDIRASLNQLGEITGSVTTEDILNRIFDQFCIGK